MVYSIHCKYTRPSTLEHCKYTGPSTLECIVIVYTKLFKYTQYTRVYSDCVQYTLQVHQTQYTIV